MPKIWLETHQISKHSIVSTNKVWKALTTKMQKEYLKLDQILKKKMMHCCHDVTFCCNDISHIFLRHENISQLAPASSLILAYNTSNNDTPPISRVLIGRHWFFADWRHHHAVTRLKNVRQSNIRRGNKLGVQPSHKYPLVSHLILQLLRIQFENKFN